MFTKHPSYGLAAPALVVALAIVNASFASFPAVLDAAESSQLAASALDDPRRPAEHKSTDAGRKALEVYEFFGVEPGLTVADLWAATGYNTMLLSIALGDESTVYAAHGFYTLFQDGEIARQLEQLVAEQSLTNVIIAPGLADIPDASVDVAIAIRSYHDTGQPYAQLSRPEAVAQIYRMLKPGGVAGIVDVAAAGPGWDEEAHRLGEAAVIEEFEAGGFELEATSDLLRNPDDSRHESGFPNRHLTDRYVLKFRKPAE